MQAVVRWLPAVCLRQVDCALDEQVVHSYRSLCEGWGQEGPLGAARVASALIRWVTVTVVSVQTCAHARRLEGAHTVIRKEMIRRAMRWGAGGILLTP